MMIYSWCKERTEERSGLGPYLNPAYKDREILVWGHCEPEANSEVISGKARNRV